MPECARFFCVDDPLDPARQRVIYYGSIDLRVIRLFHWLFADVPAPFRGDQLVGATPREMIQAQFPFKPNIVGPMRLRHLRAVDDWRRPDSWPLLEAVYNGQAVDLYYAHFIVAPSRSILTGDCIPPVFSDFARWCRIADRLGFVGADTNEGYAPFLIVLSSTAGAAVEAEAGVEIDSSVPEWLQEFFSPGGSVLMDRQ